jgi:hypothetical protein
VIEPVLVLAWLVFAHLVADFVLQNDWIAINKAQGGRTGWAALLVHGGHVALCLVPVVFAFGIPGLVYLVLVAGTHVLVDRWKVLATRRADAAAQEAARRRLAAGTTPPPSGLGAAWTPWPGMLFLADQALHLTFAIVGWLILLEGVGPTGPFLAFTDALFRDWDPVTVHAVLLTGVVLTSLFIVNTRGAYYFVLALVSPREVQPELAGTVTPPAAPAPQGYTVRVGPLVATVEPSAAVGVSAGTQTPPDAAETRPGETRPGEARPGDVPAAAPSTVSPGVPVGAPARIGATIGALERLLIVVFVLTRTEAAIGFVVAAKTLARFKQLDDRGFAEYYLLGTLASVAVALFSGLLGLAALSSLP